MYIVNNFRSKQLSENHVKQFSRKCEYLREYFRFICTIIIRQFHHFSVVLRDLSRFFLAGIGHKRGG